MQTLPFYRKKLLDEFTQKRARNPRLSLRGFARWLGIPAPALSQILSGKRFLSVKLAEHLMEQLELSPDEYQEFLTSLAQSRKAKGLKRSSRKLRQCLKRKDQVQEDYRELSMDRFRVIADWYHYAILELTLAKDFESHPSWIAKALNLSELEVIAAIDRLQALELLEWREGRLQKTVAHYEITDKHLTSAALKKRQRQILEKSIDSLENDPISERNHSAMTLAIDPTLIPEAKERIQKFLQEMTTFLESRSQERVYELTVNLFPVQKK